MRAPITITNVLPTGSAFAATVAATPVGVFVPSAIARRMNLAVGHTVRAVLVPNVHAPVRTPYLAHQLLELTDPPVSPDVFMSKLVETAGADRISTVDFEQAVRAWVEGDYDQALDIAERR